MLLVSNMSETETECDHLFILFGVYGDVQVGGNDLKKTLHWSFLSCVTLQRVKILFNKKDTALIQMAEPQQAMLAISHLDKCKLWGKVTKILCLDVYLIFYILQTGDPGDAQQAHNSATAQGRAA